MPGPYSRKNKVRFARKKRQNASQKNKRYIKARKGAYHQQRQLLSLQKQNQRLYRKIRDRAQYAQFFVPIDQPDDGTNGNQKTLPNGEFYVTDLVKPNGFAAIFQSSSTTTLSNKFQFRSYDIQMLFSPKNSETPLTPRVVRVYLLGLRSETATRTLNETQQMTSDGLNQASPNTYTRVTNSDGGLPTLVKFNPACFKIHAYREFLVGNILNETANVVEDEDQASTNLKDPIKRARIFHKMSNKLKTGIGSWREITPNQLMPNDRRFLVVHVGGWGGAGVDGDNQVVMNTNIVVNGRLTN